MAWGNPVEIETHRRVMLTVAAYAYEIASTQIMTDAEYDAMSRAVDLSINTTRPDLDAWWRQNFDPSTGMWIRQHPEIDRVRAMYESRVARKRQLTAPLAAREGLRFG